jgi:hypothetical protein
MTKLDRIGEDCKHKFHEKSFVGRTSEFHIVNIEMQLGWLLLIQLSGRMVILKYLTT